MHGLRREYSDRICIHYCTLTHPCIGCRAFGNPSYHVQALFAEHQGLHYAQTQIDSLSARDNGVAASVTCQDNACTRLSIKVRPHTLHALHVCLAGQCGGEYTAVPGIFSTPHAPLQSSGLLCHCSRAVWQTMPTVVTDVLS